VNSEKLSVRSKDQGKVSTTVRNKKISPKTQNLISDEKKALAEAKKAAKLGNKDVAKIHAKQVIRIRKQRTRSYTAGAQMSAVQNQMSVMEANNRMAKAMGASAKEMKKMNKGNKSLEKDLQVKTLRTLEVK